MRETTKEGKREKEHRGKGLHTTADERLEKGDARGDRKNGWGLKNNFETGRPLAAGGKGGKVPCPRKPRTKSISEWAARSREFRSRGGRFQRSYKRRRELALEGKSKGPSRGILRIAEHVIAKKSETAKGVEEESIGGRKGPYSRRLDIKNKPLQLRLRTWGT